MRRHVFKDTSSELFDMNNASTWYMQVVIIFMYIRDILRFSHRVFKDTSRLTNAFIYSRFDDSNSRIQLVKHIESPTVL